MHLDRSGRPPCADRQYIESTPTQHKAHVLTLIVMRLSGTFKVLAKRRGCASGAVRVIALLLFTCAGRLTRAMNADLGRSQSQVFEIDGHRDRFRVGYDILRVIIWCVELSYRIPENYCIKMRNSGNAILLMTVIIEAPYSTSPL
jgi:hypothetical protein